MSESINASSTLTSLCRFLSAPGPVPRSGRYRERRKPVHQGSLHTPSAPAPPCQKSPLAKRLEGQTYSGEEKSMLLKWKPPQIVNGKDDDSLKRP
ncbi:hypothetical protein J4734_19710 [Klebsiella pneumoniae]|uniref:Uncharacterized protein n=1 Tax=Klebsiella pneumoniae TaxID=573 RepID=A0A939SQA2_KLEPN|nr:hypothetical protein [Klebsiella pneumoniae]